MTTPTDGPINPVTGMTEEALEALMNDEMIDFDPVAVNEALDLIAQLQSDEPPDDPAVIAEAHRLWPKPMDWFRRERFRAIASGRIPDEPEADEDPDELVYDDLASD